MPVTHFSPSARACSVATEDRSSHLSEMRAALDQQQQRSNGAPGPTAAALPHPPVPPIQLPPHGQHAGSTTPAGQQPSAEPSAATPSTPASASAAAAANSDASEQMWE